MNPSHLTDHMQAAERLMKAGEYDAAYHELEAAAESFINYKAEVNRAIDASIAHLLTLGCRTTPPHPIALPLIKLRRRLAA
jgi:hypothetical protein